MSNGYAYAGARMARQSVRAQTEVAEVPEDGIILTDLALNPLAFDSGAIAILTDVNRRNGSQEAHWSLPNEVTEAFWNLNHDLFPGVRISFRGQKYEYYCSMFHVEPQDGALGQAMITLYLHRGSSANNAILQISAECSLTPREEEVLTGIAIGLTSKEVAQRLKISPNTVKTYLRLIMVKMGVTTRSAIVGRLLNCEHRQDQNE